MTLYLPVVSESAMEVSFDSILFCLPKAILFSVLLIESDALLDLILFQISEVASLLLCVADERGYLC